MASTIRRVVAGVGAVGLLAIGVQLFGTTSASAHDNYVSGVASCQSDGTYTVTWTVTNDYKESDVVTTNSYSPAGSTLSPDTLSLAATGYPGDSATMTQSDIPGTATAADLDVKGYWKDDNYTVDSSKGHVDLTGTCLPGKAPAAPTWANGGCVNNAVTQPTITIPSDADVAYTVNGTPRDAGTYPVAPGDYTVKATSTKYTLNPDTWTFTLTSSSTGCTTTVVPVNPSVTQASCNGNTPTNPTLTFDQTPGIGYSTDKPAPFTQGETVVVTATPKAGYTLGTLPAGWTKSGDNATLTITFDAKTCSSTVVPVTPNVTEASCNGTTPTNPTLTYVPTTGIEYSTDKQAPFTQGEQVVVTAKTLAGFVFGALPSGWTTNGDTETTTITFATKDCTVTVTPTTPKVTETSCVDHSPTAPTLTLVPTTGVTYSTGTPGPYTPGQSVVVTATTDKGYQFTDVPAGWTKVDSSTATTTVTFAQAQNCGTGATPVNPKLSQSACQANSTTPTAPTLTLVKTPGLTYRVSKKGPYTTGETVVVTATAGKGHYLSGVASPWKVVSDTVATRSVTFAAGPTACTEGVTVTKASFSSQQCVSGKATPATYTIPATTGVTYQVNGKPTAAGTYTAAAGTKITVVAVAKPHYQVLGQTVWTKSFGATPQCSDQDNQNVHKPTSDNDNNSGTGPLASTGVPTSSLLGVGLGLLLVGGLFTIVATRRRTDGS